MTAPAENPLLGALEAVADALTESRAPAMIIGGIAVIARGVPRQTVDVDATVWGDAVSIEALLEVFHRHHIVPRIGDALAFARDRQVLLLRHLDSGTPIEVTFASLPFEREAIGRATRVDFGGVQVVAVAVPEDLVVYKAVAWRDRDRSDIERLLLLHGPSIDLERVRRIVAEFAEALVDRRNLLHFRLASATRFRPRRIARTPYPLRTRVYRFGASPIPDRLRA
ncbi:MAG: DUF6036 family nucleotidyltransferase [Gammaproteobacteria bacterium]